MPKYIFAEGVGLFALHHLVLLLYSIIWFCCTSMAKKTLTMKLVALHCAKKSNKNSCKTVPLA